MIFEKQDYQQDCINNIINLLKDFDFKKHDANNLKEVFNNFLKDKVSAFGLSDKLNIDILMSFIDLEDKGTVWMYPEYTRKK